MICRKKDTSTTSPAWAVCLKYSWPGLEKVSNALSRNEAKEVEDKLRELQHLKGSSEVGSEDNPDILNTRPQDEDLPEQRHCITSFHWTYWLATQVILKALALDLGIGEDPMMKSHSGQHKQFSAYT